MIQIPKQVSYIQLYYTLKCNLACQYCINSILQVKRSRKQLSSQCIAGALNKINFNNIALTIGGGEPTLRKDFYDLINSLNNNIKIDLLTNLTFDPKVFIKNIQPDRFYKNDNSAYKSIRVSYHPKYMNREQLINKALQLQERGFQIGIFGISHPQNMRANTIMSQLSRKNKVYFFIKDFLGSYKGHMFGYYLNKDAMNGNKKKCKCRTKQILIDAAGNVFKCHKDLYSNQYPVGNILGDGFKFRYEFRKCQNFGLCNPCDLKIKLNRFMNDGNCNIQLMDIK